MQEEVRVLSMGPHEYAAEVDEGEQTTRHRVLVSGVLLDDPELAGTDEEVVVQQSIRCLLDRMPNTALPHDIDLGELAAGDARFRDELRTRLAA